MNKSIFLSLAILLATILSPCTSYAFFQEEQLFAYRQNAYSYLPDECEATLAKISDNQECIDEQKICDDDLSDLNSIYKNLRLAHSHRVVEVLAEGHKVVLNDGSIWQMLVWYDDPSVPLARSWQPGNVVEFHTDGEVFHCNGRMAFELKNISNGSKVSAWLEVAPSLENSHYIVSLEKRGRNLTLSDGSAWEMSWWQSWSSSQWREGDRLFISHDFKYNGYILYNLDYEEYSHCWVKAIMNFKK